MVCGVVLMEWLKQRIQTRFKGYKTAIINVVLLSMPILEMTEIFDVLPEGYAAPYAILIAVVNMYLRSVTTTPMGKHL